MPAALAQGYLLLPVLSPLTDGCRRGQLPALAATREKGQKGRYMTTFALSQCTSTMAGWESPV